MDIAVLAWGSLYWDPRELAITGKWLYDGPVLPIEYARISEDKRITLVIVENYDPVITLYAMSRFRELGPALENLRVREKALSLDNIGFCRFVDGASKIRPEHAFMKDILKKWNDGKKYEAVIWSDFLANFEKKGKMELTADNLIRFLELIKDEKEKEAALHYIKMAPRQIKTRFRPQIEAHFP